MDLFKYLDPTTVGDSSFLSFSSFADLTQSPYEDDYSSSSLIHSSFGQVCDNKPTYTSSPTPPFTHSETGSDSDSPIHPFSIISTAFSPTTPSPSSGDYGIFHTPSKAGPSKLSGPGQHVLQRSTSSSSGWNSPVTPSLTYKSSIDSLATFAPDQEFYLPPSSTSTSTAYAWDDHSLGASSSIANQSPTTPSPYRVVSNPTLNPSRHPRAIKQITSMPALKEEEQSNWLDEFVNNDSGNVDDGLGDGIDWSFPQYGSSTEMQTEGSIFQAFKDMELSNQSNIPYDDSTIAQPCVPSSSTSSELPSFPQVEAPGLLPDLSFSSVDDDAATASFYQWMNDNPLEQQQPAPQVSWPNYASTSSTGVDPMAVFQNDLRPATAPDALGIWQDNSNLGVPGPGSMLRSVSSDAVLHSRPSSQFRTDYGYAPDDILGASSSQQAWNTQPHQLSNGYAAGMPSQNFMARRNVPQNLTIDVPHAYYRSQHPNQMLTPLSAPYMGHFGYTSQRPAALPMKRSGSQPVNGSKASRRSFSGDAHQENVPPRRVTKEDASCMQPVQPPPHTFRRESMPMVWTQHMQAQIPGQPQMINVHPPQQYRQASQPLGYYSMPPQPQAHLPPHMHTQSIPLESSQTTSLAQAPRIHPPPHPGWSTDANSDNGNGGRLIARLPSAASKRPRQASSTSNASSNRTPKPRTSPGRKRNTPSGGTFSWGDTTFINFTPDDGEKLLTGVAPSGSQSKRRREEELAQAGLLAVAAALSRPGSSDGSELGDDNRSKRSRSGNQD